MLHPLIRPGDASRGRSARPRAAAGLATSLTLVLVLCLAAGSTTSAQSPPSSPAADGTAAGSVAASTPQGGDDRTIDQARRDPVTVVDRGSRPRRLLRYTLVEGQREALAMDMRVSMRTRMPFASVDVTDMPTIRVVASVEVIEVRPDGTSLVEEVISDVGVPSGEDADLSLAAALEQEMSTLVGLVCRMDIDRRGAVLRSETIPPPGLSAEAQQTLQGSLDTLTDLVVPLPAEPVGEGAVWQIRQPLDADMGFRVTQSMRYRLVRSGGGRIVLGITGRQFAARQELDAADLEPGMDFTVKSYTATIEGRNTLDLDLLVPNSRIRMRSEGEFRAREDGEVLTFSMGLAMRASVRPVPADAAGTPSGSSGSFGSAAQAVRSDRGFEVTFPVGWRAEETSPETHAWLYEDEGGEDPPDSEPVLWAFRSGAEEACTVYDFTRYAKEPPAWVTIDDAVAGEMEWLTGESGLTDAESSILGLGAGRTGRLGAVDADGWVTTFYLYTDGDAWFRLECWSPDPPDDRWLPIARTFAFAATATSTARSS